MFIAPTATQRVENLVAHAAFNLIKDSWLAAPGVTYPSLVTEYEMSDTLEHVTLIAPGLHPGLGSLELDGMPAVHWLMLLPISESEYEFLVGEGLDDLENRLESSDAPYWDLTRQPVV